MRKRFGCRLFCKVFAMRAGWLQVDLLIPMAHSLKEKRRPLKSLLEKLRNRFNVSAAAVDCQDMHGRAVIGVAIVASDGHMLGRERQKVKEFIYNNPDCQVVDMQEQSLGWHQE